MKGSLARLRRGLRDESGQAAVLAAVGLTVILSFAGLAIDVGQLRYAQSKLQAAADASAIAGAMEISYCGGTADCSIMQTAAQQALVENRLTGSALLTQCASKGGSNLTLTVNNGPCVMGAADPNYGNTNYVEAVITEAQPTYFARVLAINSIKIAARAEAAMGNSPFCVDTLGTTGTTFGINGGCLTASCGIMVNSSGSPAFDSSGGTIKATAIDIHGGDKISGSVNPTPITNAATLPNPLSWVTAPKIGSCTFTSTFSVSSGSAAISPGTYCGGISINGGAVNFNSGTYIVEGSGLTVNGGTVTSGTDGVTFYFEAGSAQFNGSASVDLVAPTTGTYPGILFFQSSTDSTAATINGGAASVFQGALYFPDANVQLNGSNAAAYTIVVSESMQVNGGNFSLGNNYSSLPGGSPAKSVTSFLAQ